MAHRSWCAESGEPESNERLEFLGDAVLGLVVTDHIYAAYPDLDEGELAKLRAAVVNSEVLAEVGAELGLGEAILLGRGEETSGGRRKTSILADATEAVIGAVYLDGGLEAARQVVMGFLSDRIAQAADLPGALDYKGRLQELVVRLGQEPPSYQVRDEGPDHAKHFFATVSVGGAVMGKGEGRSKKQAEQQAAKQAWERLAAS